MSHYVTATTAFHTQSTIVLITPMGNSITNLFDAFISSIPDAALTSITTQKDDIAKDVNFRLDMQGVTKSQLDRLIV